MQEREQHGTPDTAQNSFSVWGFEVADSWVTPAERTYLLSLPTKRPTVEWVWAEMDRVWRSMDMDNRRPLGSQRIGEFYSHPVWLMNGIFTHADPVSAGHRRAIAEFVRGLDANRTADYGGGFGELAIALSNTSPSMAVSIVEPFPTRAAQCRVRDMQQVTFVDAPEVAAYDVIVAEDVLEHVEGPLQLAHTLALSVRDGGCLILANCFYPVIQCHLPSTFHLRHTFRWVMQQMGLTFVGRVPNATHALVFQRGTTLDLKAGRRAERLSRLLGPALNAGLPTLRRAKRFVLR